MNLEKIKRQIEELDSAFAKLQSQTRELEDRAESCRYRLGELKETIEQGEAK